ncbi:MAG: anti-sigma F factor [Ruminococcaceae bacterium]|nr:anti-sigma F factor [Oscillospiraceae bacterium]
MSIRNHITVEFLSKSENEGFARVVVSALLAQLDPTIEELADVKTAVSEAVTNAIVHGYGENRGYITMDCTLEEESLTVIIKDGGKGIEDVKKAMEPLYTSNPDAERSGMGFTVMETFMDEVQVESIVGVGTKVTMTKRLGTKRL